jgi:hypothetical protein
MDVRVMAFNLLAEKFYSMKYVIWNKVEKMLTNG